LDGERFDALTRRLAGASTRRTALKGVGAALVGLLAGGARVVAACPAEQIYRQGRCVCKVSGRPPVNGLCPCPSGETRCPNGCTRLTNDSANCGACGIACPRGAHATQVVCRAGTCRVASCEVGWADCDGSPDNGCETPLGSATNCTGCDQACLEPIPACRPDVGCVECLTPTDCPPPATSCLAATCAGDTCGTEATNEGGACGADKICCGGVCYDGDCCTVAACDDGNPCTDDTCTGHVCQHPPRDDSLSGVCSDDQVCCAGACEECCVPADCPATGSVCLAATCDGNACGTTPANERGACGEDGICCDGTCILDADCCDSDDCTTDAPYCIANICRQCTEDADCQGVDPNATGLTCVDTACVATGCVTGYHLCAGRCASDADANSCGERCEPCPSGSINGCVRSVEGDYFCAGSSECVGGCCPESCTTFADCDGIGNACVEGVCVECGASADCLPGDLCAPAVGVGCHGNLACYDVITG
jgi:hypothetical protein